MFRRLKRLANVSKENARLKEELADVKRRSKNKNGKIESLQRDLARAREGTPIFFIVGEAKSGTSWLMWMLGAHPEILCPGEGRLFGREFKREDIMRREDLLIPPSSLYGALLDAEYLDAWVRRSVWTRGEDAEQLMDGIARAVMDHCADKKLSRRRKRIAGEKTGLQDELLGEIKGVYPEARIVHIIRDGRDVAVSWVHHTWIHAKQDGGVQEASPESLDKRARYRADPEAFLKSGESIFAERQLEEVAQR